MTTDSYLSRHQDERFWSDLEAGREVFFRGSGRSMLPLFPSGTLFLLRRAEVGDLRPGDVILLKLGESVLLHRYLGRTRKEPPRLLTKGDWISEADKPSPPGALRGRAIGVVRRGRIRPLETCSVRLAGRMLARLSPPFGRLLGVARRLLRSGRGLISHG